MLIRIGVFGINEEVLRLAELLKTNPNAQIVRYWTADADTARTQAIRVGGDVAAQLERHMTEDMNAFLADGNLDAVVDSGAGPSFLSVFPNAGGGRLQVLRPLTARLLWAYGDVGQDRKSELLQALAEVVELVDLAIDTDALFLRMLDIAVEAAGADGGSLMFASPTAWSANSGQRFACPLVKASRDALRPTHVPCCYADAPTLLSFRFRAGAATLKVRSVFPWWFEVASSES
jgi:hypothetical protein